MNITIRDIIIREQEYAGLPPDERERLTAIRKTQFANWVKCQPPAPCPRHPKELRAINVLASEPVDGLDTGGFPLVYDSCPQCIEDAQRERLHGIGVPSTLLHATVEGWHGPEHVRDRVREFVAIGRGFLILLGPVGTGKSHLAAAVMREVMAGWYVKQSALLLMLRQTYRDNEALNPMPKGKEARLFVLDEIGVSGGGRDEGPMIHEILSYRYEEMRPTILTSNLTYPQLTAVLGERMADRLDEATFALLELDGRSYRKSINSAYVNSISKRPLP